MGGIKPTHLGAQMGIINYKLFLAKYDREVVEVRLPVSGYKGAIIAYNHAGWVDDNIAGESAIFYTDEEVIFQFNLIEDAIMFKMARVETC